MDSTALTTGPRFNFSLLFIFAEFLKARIVPERIEHGIEPKPFDSLTLPQDRAARE
jgi:hypothetical protein